MMFGVYFVSSDGLNFVNVSIAPYATTVTTCVRYKSYHRNFLTLFQKLSSNNLYYKDIHVQRLFVTVVWPRIHGKSCYDSRLSRTKVYKTTQAEIHVPGSSANSI